MLIKLDNEVQITDFIGVINQWGKPPGHFIQLIFDAWSIGDPGNKALVTPLLKKVVEKYKLDEEYLKILRDNTDACKASVQFLTENGLEPQL